MNHVIRLFICSLILSLGACTEELPPFPGKAPQRAVYGTPPPTVNPDIWFRDVKTWGAEIYLYYSPHFQGNLYRQQAGLPSRYDGPHLKQLAFLGASDNPFTPFLDRTEIEEQESFALEAYQACLAQEMEFFYGFSFPVFPILELETIRKVQPEIFEEDGSLNLSHPALREGLSRAIHAFKAAMPAMSGISLELFPDRGGAYAFTQSDIKNQQQWLPPLIQQLADICEELQIQAWVATDSPWHTNGSRRKTYETINRHPQLTIFAKATWPEETTLMPYLGFLPAEDTVLIKKNQVAVNVLTDTEYMGQGKMPGIFPRWWQYLAQQAYLRESDIVVARSFHGDQGGTATNFNRLNLQLLLRFLETPNASLKGNLREVNEEMFGYDFPSRLTSIMIIAEDAFQAISSVNYINFLDRSEFPPPAFLDRTLVPKPYTMKAIDDLFEPPGTPLYPEETEQPDTLGINVHWRWQQEVSARPVDQYLEEIEKTIDWLDKIQKEVDYLTLDFPPEQRQIFVGGYRDMLLLGRGMYQFVQGAAVYHRWFRLKKITKQEAIDQLEPIAKQIRLIAVESKGSSFQLQERLLRMANAFERLEFEDYQN